MVGILGVIAVMVMPEVQKVRVRARAATESENLRAIEAAKVAWSRANPGKELKTLGKSAGMAALAEYLPGNAIPESPWMGAAKVSSSSDSGGTENESEDHDVYDDNSGNSGGSCKDDDGDGKITVGEYYVNLLDLDKTVASPMNGNAAYEPPVEPLDANGFNDIATASLVYYKKGGTDPWRGPRENPDPVTGSGPSPKPVTGVPIPTGSPPPCPQDQDVCLEDPGSRPANLTMAYYFKIWNRKHRLETRYKLEDCQRTGAGAGAGTGAGTGDGSGIWTGWSVMSDANAVGPNTGLPADTATQQYRKMNTGVSSSWYTEYELIRPFELIKDVGDPSTITEGRFGAFGADADGFTPSLRSLRDSILAAFDGQNGRKQQDLDNRGSLVKYVDPDEKGDVDDYTGETAGWTSHFVNRPEFSKVLDHTELDVLTPIPPGCPSVFINYFHCSWNYAYLYTWVISPVLIDLDATGDVDKLAPFGWNRQSRKAFDPFSTRLFEMIPGKKELWEWVTPKAGILMYGKTMPATASGTNLFGNFTWGKIWKHGYEPMATLDRDHDGFLRGSELAELWVWRDLDSDAVLDPGEVKPASEVVMSLGVIPQFTKEGGMFARDLTAVNSVSGGDAYLSQGAQLVGRVGSSVSRSYGDPWYVGLEHSIPQGKWVGTWDWWSRSVPYSNIKDSIPQADPESVCMYRWEQTGLLPGQTPEQRFKGYFLISKVNRKLVVASVPDDSGDLLMAGVAKMRYNVNAQLAWEFKVPPKASQAMLANLKRARDAGKLSATEFPSSERLDLAFRGLDEDPKLSPKDGFVDGYLDFKTYSEAMYLDNGMIVGSTCLPIGFGFYWKASPMKTLDTNLSRSLASVVSEELTSYLDEGVFYFQPVSKESYRPPFAMLDLMELLQLTGSN